MIFGIYLLLIVVGASAHWYAAGRPRTSDRVIEISLLYLLAVGAGVSGIVGFMGHAFDAAKIARSIGWQPGSPFQFEVAIANLSLGVLGLMCIRVRGSFWLATGIGTSVMFLGCNYQHLYDAFAHNNYAPNNYGIINVFEFVWPVAVLILLVPYMRSWSRSCKLTP